MVPIDDDGTHTGMKILPFPLPEFICTLPPHKFLFSLASSMPKKLVLNEPEV